VLVRRNRLYQPNVLGRRVGGIQASAVVLRDNEAGLGVTIFNILSMC
jgi:hypothetical protein